jgi:hypothetical protein
MYQSIKRIERSIRHHVIYPYEHVFLGILAILGSVLIIGILGSGNR